jgi:hypothetical protein
MNDYDRNKQREPERIKFQFLNIIQFNPIFQEHNACRA